MNAIPIIDQRDIQKRGGVCSRYPVACLIADILHSVDGTRVLDVTYGEGRFYRVYRPEWLVAADPYIWNWVVKPDIFIPLPVWKLLNFRFLEIFRTRVLVCDPPWGVRHRKRPQYRVEDILIGSSETIITYAFKVAEKFNIPYLLLHYNRLWNQEGWTRVQTLLFRYVSRYLNNPDLKKTTYFMLYERGIKQG